MIINDEAAKRRLNSPLNLINRLKDATTSRSSAMGLFCGPKDKEKIKSTSETKKEEIVVSFNPFEQSAKQEELIPISPSNPQQETQVVTLDSILKDNESQIKLGLAHDKALELLNNSVSLLSEKLDDIKADKLPYVVTAASKVVEGIRKERNEANKNNKDREVHYHFYTPSQRKISDYAVIDVK